MARDRSRRQGWVGRLEYILGHAVTRFVLSAAIIISLVPHEWMHANDAWFLLLFLPEFVARAILACRKESEDGTPDPIEGYGWRSPRGGDVFLLSVDFVAIVSFLPLQGWLGAQARWLRIFRLTRTIMLLRYWAPLVRDLWSVLRRRERARQLSLMAGAVVVVAFAGTVFLNHATSEIGEDFDGDGNVGDAHDHVFWVRMWWAFRQIQDPGNMLASPHEIATLIVSVFLTVFGLFLVSFLIGVGTDVVSELMDLSRLRSSGLRRHNVLINVTAETRQLLYEVMGEYRKLVPEGLRLLSPRWFRELRNRFRQQREFVVVGSGDEPPDFLREPEFARIIYRENSDDDDEAFLDRADVPLARRVVVLADTEAPEPDDETVRTLLTIVERLRETADVDASHRTTLIAEVLDESNIGAAHKAISRASAQVDAHVIPTERLVALFTFCVARRGGVARLLMTMLTSAGHELYMYDYRRSEQHGGRVPQLPLPLSQAFESLYWRGLDRAHSRRILPVGMLTAEPGDASSPASAVLNPGSDAMTDDHASAVGFVALAPNMRVASLFADEVFESPTATPSPAPASSGAFALPALSPAPTSDMRRVLICGFRPATVGLIEAIVTSEPDTQVLVMVEDARARKEALDAFDGHSNLVSTGLLAGARGLFEPTDEPGVLGCIPGEQAGHAGRAEGRIFVEVGDWTSSRQLMRLPRNFGTAPQMDLVVMVSSRRHGSDATITTALMKLEHLQEHLQRRTGQAPSQTVVAELINADLAHRLTRRYEAMGRENVIVFSIHELRAFFMFQSVVVPNFSLVYGQLMAPWGQSFVRLDAVGERHGVCTFAQLAAQLRTATRIPLAVELRDPVTGERSLYIGQGDPSQDDLIDLSRLTAVWVIRPEQRTKTARYTTQGTQVGPPPSAPEVSVPAQ